MADETSPSAEEDARASRLEWAAQGLCVHAHCPLDGPHWHGGIWRSGHMREAISSGKTGDCDE